MVYLDLVLQAPSEPQSHRPARPRTHPRRAHRRIARFLPPDLVPAAGRVLDLGTGAGVPGMTLAVWGAGLHLTLLDRTRKKIDFVRRATGSLGLANCHPAWGSAEDLSRGLPSHERFDAVVSRGAGSIAHLIRPRPAAPAPARPTPPSQAAG